MMHLCVINTNLKIIMGSETALEWIEKIQKIREEIKSKYPELAKDIKEMPVILKADGSPDNDPRHMKTYFESLQVLLDAFAISHESSVI
jgi:hypothetical protein